VTTESEEKIITYLKERVSKGHMYFKAKYIAKDLGESPKRIGNFLFKFSKKEKIPGIEIQAWMSSLSTTWRVINDTK
jgi:hypothetical protein